MSKFKTEKQKKLDLRAAKNRLLCLKKLQVAQFS